MLLLLADGQTVVGGSGDRVGVQGADEVLGLDDGHGLGVELDLDLDRVADGDTGSGPVGVAEADQVTATHDRDSSAPGMPVDRDGHPRSLAPAEPLNGLGWNLQS